jgi:hypothetical protein
LAWRQLKLLLFGSANKNAGQPAKKTSSKSRRQHSVIPDEVGNYVDYTEVK